MYTCPSRRSFQCVAIRNEENLSEQNMRCMHEGLSMRMRRESIGDCDLQGEPFGSGEHREDAELTVQSKLRNRGNKDVMKLGSSCLVR